MVRKIRDDVVKVLNDRSFYATSVVGMGFTGVGSTPEEFTAFIRADDKYKGDLVKSAGIKID